jgi:drug/metabolite transporter (DMT)-like permease
VPRDQERRGEINRKALLGAVMALISAAGFGTIAILAKLAYAGGMTVAQLLSLRFLLATIGVFVLSCIVGGSPFKIKTSKQIALLVMGGGCYGLQSFFFFTALRHLSASLVELLLYVYPVFVVVASWFFFGRSIDKQILAVLVTSLVGVALLAGGFSLSGSAAVLLALAAPLCYTIYLLAAEPMIRGEGALPAGTFVMAGAALFWLVVVLDRHEFMLPSDIRSWSVLLALAIVPSMVAIPLLLAAIARIGGQRVALISTLEPVVTLVLAFIFLGERLMWPQIVGALLVLGSITVLLWPSRPALRLGSQASPLRKVG